jgi:hypothetical protein
MRITLAAILLGALASGTAMAEDTVVIHRSAPGIVVEHEAPAVIERRRVDTSSSVGCESKTVTKTNDEGESKTVRTERCD